MLTLVALLAASVGWCCGVRMTDLQVPATADVRENVTMVCKYSMDGVQLYSVKWYKDEFEFYRYMPDGNPSPSQAFPVPGVTLIMDQCGEQTVTLTNLTFNSTGSYKCEVSEEGPSFNTVFLSSNMTVTGNPQWDPVVKGVLPSYNSRDHIRAVCNAAPSYPAASLLWYINGRLVEDGVEELEPETDARGLVSARKSLGVMADQRGFHEGGRLRLRCDAVVNDITRSTEVVALLGGVGTERLQANPNNAGNPFAGTKGVLLIVLAASVMTSSHRH